MELTENPFTATVLTPRLSTTCSYCFAVSNQTAFSKLLRCSKCKFVYYCSSKCQMNDWSHHKRECQRLRRFHSITDETGIIRQFPNGILENETDNEYLRQFPDESMRLIGRLMDVWDRSVSTYSSGGRGLHSLESHENEIGADPILKQQFFAFCGFYEFYCTGDVTGGRPDYDKAKLLKIYGLCRSNAFCIKDPDGTEPIGCGIYINLRRLTHSCLPNARIISCGRQAKVVIFADWDTTKNEFVKPTMNSYDQIRVSYVDCLMTKTERQRLLREVYFIDCHCDGCELDQARNDSMEGLRCDSADGCDGVVVRQHDDEDVYKCRSCGKTYDNTENGKLILKLTKDFLDVPAMRRKAIAEPAWAREVLANLACMQIPTLPRLNIYYLRTIKSCFETACRLGNWADATAYGDDLLDGYRRYLNEDSDPDYAITALNVAKAHINNLRKDEALKLLEICERCFNYAFEPDSYLCLAVSRLIDLCRQSVFTDTGIMVPQDFTK